MKWITKYTQIISILVLLSLIFSSTIPVIAMSDTASYTLESGLIPVTQTANGAWSGSDFDISNLHISNISMGAVSSGINFIFSLDLTITNNSAETLSGLQDFSVGLYKDNQFLHSFTLRLYEGQSIAPGESRELGASTTAKIFSVDAMTFSVQPAPSPAPEPSEPSFTATPAPSPASTPPSTHYSVWIPISKISDNTCVGTDFSLGDYFFSGFTIVCISTTSSVECNITNISTKTLERHTPFRFYLHLYQNGQFRATMLIYYTNNDDFKPGETDRTGGYITMNLSSIDSILASTDSTAPSPATSAPATVTPSPTANITNSPSPTSSHPSVTTQPPSAIATSIPDSTPDALPATSAPLPAATHTSSAIATTVPPVHTQDILPSTAPPVHTQDIPLSTATPLPTAAQTSSAISTTIPPAPTNTVIVPSPTPLGFSDPILPMWHAPKVKIKVKRYSSRLRLSIITLTHFKGKYAEIFYSKNRKSWKKVKLKKARLKGKKKTFRIGIDSKNIYRLYFRIRTYKKSKGRKTYSAYYKSKNVL